jgi:hypothetical protein
VAQGKTLDGRTDNRRQPVSSARLIELVDSRRQHSIRYNQTLFSKLLGWYHTYRGYWRDRSSQFRNNLSIPFTFAMIQSDVARKVQSSFSTWPIVSFEGYAPEDASRAKKNEVLISAQMKDCDSVGRAVDFFLQDAICGTAVCRYGWKNITRKSRRRRMEQVAPGLSIPITEEYQAEIFNGPNWEVIDRLDFWQQPGKSRIADMQWVIHRYWMDLDDMVDDVNGPYPYFDKSAVNLMREFPLSGTVGSQEFQARRLTFRNEFDYMARQSEKFAKPVEIWEMHGLVPDEFAPDGIRSRCIAIGNGRVVLKNRESPMPDQAKPFISFSSMPDPYGFDGIGKAEIADKPQRIADRIANQKLDALDLVIDPQWVMNSSVNINTQNLMSRAGRIILVDGPADDSTIRPLSPDMSGLSAAYNEVTTLFQYMQLGLGINDIVMGMQGGGRETARGFLGRQENVLTRLAMETKLAEERFIEPLANAFRKLDREFLDMPHEVKIMGSLAQTNPITGLPYQPENVTVDADDLVPDYRARAVGASQMMGRSVRQQNLMGLLQVMSANPAMVQLVNWASFARQAFELFDFKNVDDLLVNQVPMVNAMADSSGQSPEAISAMASTSLENLSPEILGQMMQTSNPSPLGAAA